MTAKKDVQTVLDATRAPPDPTNPAVRLYLQELQRALQLLSITAGPVRETTQEKCLYYHNLVLERMNAISDMYRRASSVGIFVSREPIQEILRIDRGRRIFTELPDGPDYEALILAISSLCTLVVKESSGAISLDVRPRPVVGSMEISFAGIGGLPSAIISADDLKRQQAISQLATLDFSKRRVRLLFIAERDVGGSQVELLVAWRRIADASGYRVRVSDVTIGKAHDVDFPGNVSSEQALSFYRETLQPLVGSVARERDMVLAIVPSVRRDSIFRIGVTPYQRVSTSRNDLFNSTVTRAVFTQAQIDAVGSAVAAHAGSIDGVTPYPFISEVLYGSRHFGWMLSGLNLLSSYRRGAPLDATRRYSYIGARFSDFRDQALAGNFYVPTDKQVFVDSLDNSIAVHGMTNTLGEVLEKCGMLMFFDDREGFDSGGLTIGRDAALRETSIVSTILSSVDPSTATVSPSNIYRSVSKSLPKPAVSTGTIITPHYAGRLDVSQEPIDLLTFEGISRLLDNIVDASRIA